MRGWSVTLVLCFAACRVALGAPAAGEDVARLQNFIADYTRSVAGATGGDSGSTAAAAGAGTASSGAWGGWFPPPVQLQLPQYAEGGRSVPVLLVPVPVPVPFAAPTNPTQCPLSPQPSRTLNYDSYSAPAPTSTNTAPDAQVNYGTVPVYNPALPYAPATPESPAPSAPPAPPAPSEAPPTSENPPPPPPPRSPSRRPSIDERLARSAPKFPPAEDSRLLVEQFRAQEPKDPSLPPIVIDPVGVVSTDDYTVEELEAAGINSHKKAMGSESSQVEETLELSADPHVSAERKRVICRRRKAVAGEDEALVSPPPHPRFERSLLMRARLTVPRADYTEPYSIWWDAASGASRIDFHGGSSSTYRMMKRDGRVQSVQISVDRTGETDVRRCMVTSPRRMSLAERSLPSLPDLQFFSFAGYVQRGAERTERWRYTLSGHSGELGGVRGEALTFRHELLVSRAPDNFTTIPLRYAVRVDSSVLGADCDTYVHHFDEVQTQHHDSAMFNLNIGDACEHVEVTNRMDIVEPLREFTMLRRDPRHDIEIDQFKKKFDRVYGDDVEEAVRKNILMQNVRYTASANRQGASFEMGINFLSDRLAVERRVMLGVERTPDADPGEPFPHPLSELEALRGRLPRNFDWRERGAVTPVRNQLLCASCWAFATTGAVEGALFVETGRLVPLSEQALVDCSKPWGGHGCKPTWPSFAYNYIKDRGLPALDEYTSYQGKELTCRADSVPSVTRISGHVNVTKHIIAIKVAIKKYGPTVVLIDGETDSFIGIKKGGYYHDGRCKKDKANHAVLAVGWTVHRGETYFILKNSWTAGWADDGYARVRASTNTCGVLNRASHPRLRSTDVQRVPAGAPAAIAPPAS